MEYNVKVLSICKNNKVVDEKYEWIDKYIPFLIKEDLVFLIKRKKIQGIESNELKSNYLKKILIKNHINIVSR